MLKFEMVASTTAPGEESATRKFEIFLPDVPSPMAERPDLALWLLRQCILRGVVTKENEWSLRTMARLDSWHALAIYRKPERGDLLIILGHWYQH